MRDSVNSVMIPSGTPVVAGYADGLYQWSQADWDRHPAAVRLSIAVHPEDSGDVLDVERGDATPADVPGWCDRFRRLGRRAPTVYCNRSTWPACRVAAGDRPVDWWISTLDGTIDVPGAVAVQYTDTGAYDESFILDPTWVGIASSSASPAIITPAGREDPMPLDTARFGIWLYRLLLFGHRALGEQGAQAAIDSYAGRIAAGENPELVLSDMLKDAQRDPRLDPRYKL
jgi:hypothetical protein